MPGKAQQDKRSDQFVGPGGLEHHHVRLVLERAVDIGLRFKHRARFMNPRDDQALNDIAAEPTPWTGSDLSDLLSDLEEKYLPCMPNFASPMFAGFPDAGNNLAAMAGALLGELVDVNLINADFCSRGATEMEIALIRWLRELVGFEVAAQPAATAPEVGGIPTSGGTGANFAAMLMARERAFPGSRVEGVPTQARPIVVFPEGIGHYTVAAAAAWAGLGNSVAVAHPVRNYRYDLPELDQRLASARARGDRVIMAVCYAGDSRTMTIDRLGEFAEVVRYHYPRAWLHCDGCHGTSLLFSRRHRRHLDGLQQYDSVMLDPHKVLAVPYTNSFLLLRSPSDAGLVATESELILREARSFGQITPAVGSRSFQSLRTWMLIKALGIEGVGRMIETRIDIAYRFAALVDEHPRFLRLNEVNINSVVFTVVPVGASVPFDALTATESATLTSRIYERMLLDGSIYLHSFVLPDSENRLGLGYDHQHPVLRFMSGNNLITEQDMRTLLDTAVAYIEDRSPV